MSKLIFSEKKCALIYTYHIPSLIIFSMKKTN